MNPAALPRWAVAALLFVLFAVAPSVAYLLDGPNATAADRATAAAARDVERQGALLVGSAK